jgi:hypothetical protein
LENLRKLGHTAASCELLYKNKAELEEKLRKISEELLESFWVKMGLRLGFLRRGKKAKRRLADAAVAPERPEQASKPV